MNNYSTLLKIISFADIFYLFRFLLNEPAAINNGLIPPILCALLFFYYKTFLQNRNPEGNKAKPLFTRSQNEYHVSLFQADIFSVIIVNLNLYINLHGGIQLSK